MAAYHDEVISNAERNLELGQSVMYDFGNKERAHREYMSVQRALKKKLVSGNASNAVKMLEVRRSGSKVIIAMNEEVLGFPAPVYSYETKKESIEKCTGVSFISPDKERVIQMMKSDLEEGLMTQKDFDEQMKSLGINENTMGCPIDSGA